MTILSPWPALMAVVLMLACGWLLDRCQPAMATGGRFTGVDGLRGFLAFFVFLHHSVYWYFYVRTGEWSEVDSNLYNHFGASSVMLFFMITAFLFTSKLLNSRGRALDWRRLYISRLMRLTPLYLFAMMVLFVLVAAESGYTLLDPLADVLRDAATWLGFSVFGEPDLNQVADTTQRLAGVTWSLPYEWFFYLMLPVAGLLLGLRPALPIVLATLLAAIVIAFNVHNLLAYKSFLGGIAAAFVVRVPGSRAQLSGAAGNTLAIACLTTAVILFPSGYSRPVLPLMVVAFIVIACGGSLFGLLTTNAARRIGEMGYSIYLLHGALLTVVFRDLIGVETAKRLTAPEHWLVILGCVPLLVALCALTYRLVEAPGIAAAPRVEAWLRRRTG